MSATAVGGNLWVVCRVGGVGVLSSMTLKEVASDAS
jgi:hypothetical protein